MAEILPVYWYVIIAVLWLGYLALEGFDLGVGALLPFVARTVQPVVEEIEREVEEASATLGAYRGRTLVRVILPMLTPALTSSLPDSGGLLPESILIKVDLPAPLRPSRPMREPGTRLSLIFSRITLSP